jgi:hypothetical protein
VRAVLGEDLSIPETSRADDRAEAAAYVAELAGDLASIARRHGLDALGYILDMARLEAENETRWANGQR